MKWLEPALARTVAEALADALPGSREDREARCLDVLGACDEEALASLLERVPPSLAWRALVAWILGDDAFAQLLAGGVAVEPPRAKAPSRFEVPSLDTEGDLAAWLAVTPRTLEAFTDPTDATRRAPRGPMRHYTHRWVGARLIEAPKPRLRALQRRILRGVLDAVPPHDAAHGFRRGRSIFTSAAPHVGKPAVLRVDLRRFFQTVHLARVVAVFSALGYPRAVSRAFARVCTHAVPDDELVGQPFLARQRLRTRHLPQGAPTSPALANLAAHGLDVRLSALARAAGLAYTRYADDLVFSGDVAPGFASRVASICAEEGFPVATEKTRLRRASDQQRVVGLVVNDHLGVARSERDRLRAILHNCARSGVTAENRAGHADFRAHLEGRVSFVEQADPRQGARLRRLFTAISW